MTRRTRRHLLMVALSIVAATAELPDASTASTRVPVSSAGRVDLSTGG